MTSTNPYAELPAEAFAPNIRAWSANVGGEIEATFIQCADPVHPQRVLVVAFGRVGLYASEADYWQGKPPIDMVAIR